jgi:hypothetical protein
MDIYQDIGFCFNSKKLEITQLSFDLEWINQLWYLYRIVFCKAGKEMDHIYVDVHMDK